MRRKKEREIEHVEKCESVTSRRLKEVVLIDVRVFE